MTDDEIPDRAGMPPGNPSDPFAPCRSVDRHARQIRLRQLPRVGPRHPRHAGGMPCQLSRDDLPGRRGADHCGACGVTGSEGKRDVLLSARQPKREPAATAQVGALAAFLCPDAAARTTGAALPADGGWTAQ